MIRAGILGPTGYAGLEIITILLRHPEAELVYLGSRREERPGISDIWPALKGRLEMTCQLIGDDEIPELDVMFLALPHTVAMEHVRLIRDRCKRIIDLSADYRLRSATDYETWYKKAHVDPDNLSRAAYGLSELFAEEIARADLIANPGCYPTAVILAVAPLLIESRVRSDAPLIVDAKSGVTGAGRNPKPHLHFPEANESVTAYRVGTHQHMGEMLQTMQQLAGRKIELRFVPHLVPMDRGILATCYAPLAEPTTTAELRESYASTYANARFVRLCDEESFPNTKHVTGTNFTDVWVGENGGTAIAIAAIDNLIKGAAGQAVQNMNIAFGLDETAGLL